MIFFSKRQIGFLILKGLCQGIVSLKETDDLTQGQGVVGIIGGVDVPYAENGDFHREYSFLSRTNRGVSNLGLEVRRPRP